MAFCLSQIITGKIFGHLSLIFIYLSVSLLQVFISLFLAPFFNFSFHPSLCYLTPPFVNSMSSSLAFALMYLNFSPYLCLLHHLLLVLMCCTHVIPLLSPFYTHIFLPLFNFLSLSTSFPSVSPPNISFLLAVPYSRR